MDTSRISLDPHDVAAGIDIDLDLLGAGLARVLRLEDLAELLEGLARSLDEEEVDDDDLDDDDDTDDTDDDTALPAACDELL